MSLHPNDAGLDLHNKDACAVGSSSSYGGGDLEVSTEVRMRRAFRPITHLDYRSGANLLCGGGKMR